MDLPQIRYTFDVNMAQIFNLRVGAEAVYPACTARTCPAELGGTEKILLPHMHSMYKAQYFRQVLPAHHTAIFDVYKEKANHLPTGKRTLLPINILGHRGYHSNEAPLLKSCTFFLSSTIILEEAFKTPVHPNKQSCVNCNSGLPFQTRDTTAHYLNLRYANSDPVF